MFFFSATLLLYILSIFKLDSVVSEFLPEQLIVVSAGVYILIIIRGLLPEFNSLLWFVLFVGLMYVVNMFTPQLNAFVAEHRVIIDYLFGLPLVHLIFQITNLDSLLRFPK